MEKYNLVLVDDASPILNLSKKYFENTYNVFTFDNAKSCLSSMHNGDIAPSIIVSDLTMPEMNGEEFVTEVKKDFRYKDIPFIVLSAKDDSSTKIKLLKLGVDDFIVKPFNFEELSLRIHNICKRVVLERP